MNDQGNIFTNSLYPLNLIRSSKGIPKLVFKEVEASDIPEPYYTLLVHEGDMTSRLEADQKKLRNMVRLKLPYPIWMKNYARS